MENLKISASPHINDNTTTAKIMGNVLVALFPALMMASIIFGGRALILTGFCVLTSIIWEFLCNKIIKRPNSVNDLSATLTGVLLAFNLPVTIPLWMAAIGTFVAIVIVKQIFGGLGHNFANPAIVGRIVLMLSFPAAMTEWVLPLYDFSDIVVTEPTPLVSGDETYLNLFMGFTNGCMGEVSAIALLLGGLYLIAKKIITWHEPVAFIGTVAIFSYLTGRDGLYQILAGGVMLGAIFMATDYVTTPVTKDGKIIFGIGCGIITCVIRFYCSSPEGVSYAILLMNIVTPYIDMLTRQKPIGAISIKKKRSAEEQAGDNA